MQDQRFIACKTYIEGKQNYHVLIFSIRQEVASQMVFLVDSLLICQYYHARSRNNLNPKMNFQ